MLRNITLSADETAIANARNKAQSEHTTLNAQFRQWLKQYVNNDLTTSEYKALMDSIDYVDSGGKFNRDEMNER